MLPECPSKNPKIKTQARHQVKHVCTHIYFKSVSLCSLAELIKKVCEQQCLFLVTRAKHRQRDQASAAGTPSLIPLCASFTEMNGNCFTADLFKQSKNHCLVWVMYLWVTEKEGIGQLSTCFSIFTAVLSFSAQGAQFHRLSAQSPASRGSKCWGHVSGWTD